MRFRNELGNQIDMTVTSTRNDPETKGADSITVYAEGPSSVVEHTWTRDEAFQMFHLLASEFGLVTR